MSRQQVLEMVRHGLTDVEAAVRDHPPETVTVCEMGTAAFRRGQDRLPELPKYLLLELVLLTIMTFGRRIGAMSLAESLD